MGVTSRLEVDETIIINYSRKLTMAKKARLPYGKDRVSPDLDRERLMNHMGLPDG